MQSRRLRTFLVALLCSLACVGCGSTPNDPDGGAPGTDTPATVDAGPLGESVHLAFGPDPLPLGEERTVCITVDAGNPVPRQVRGIRTHLPTGSHHMIVYRTTRALSATPTPCSPFADGASAVFIAETVNASIEYPADAALEFTANQHVRIEIHEVNYTGEPIDIHAEVDFDFHPLDETVRTPVQFLFTDGRGAFLTSPGRNGVFAKLPPRASAGARAWASEGERGREGGREREGERGSRASAAPTCS